MLTEPVPCLSKKKESDQSQNASNIKSIRILNDLDQGVLSWMVVDDDERAGEIGPVYSPIEPTIFLFRYS